MSYATIDICFWVAILVGLPSGVAFMIVWTRRVLPALTRSIDGEKRISLDSVAMKALFYGSPGLVMLVVCSVPALYFGHLRKQFTYCVEVVRVNTGITTEDPGLRERCGAFRVEELFREAGR